MKKPKKTTRSPEFYANYQRAQQLLRERIEYYEAKLKEQQRPRDASL